MTKEEIFGNTINLLGALGAEPMVEEFDWEIGDNEEVVNVSVASGDWLLEQCFDRTSAEEVWHKSFGELLGTDTWINLYVIVGRTGENRKFRLTFEVNDGDRIKTYAVRLSEEEKEAFTELAEAYCQACEGMSVDEILREAEAL